MQTWNSGSFGRSSNYPEFEKTMRMSTNQTKLVKKGKVKNFNSFVIKSLATEQDKIFNETLTDFKKKDKTPLNRHRSNHSFKISTKNKLQSPNPTAGMRKTFGSFMSSASRVNTMGSFKSGSISIQDPRKKLNLFRSLSPRSTYAPHIKPVVNLTRLEKKMKELEQIEEKRRDLDKLLEKRFQLKVEKVGIANIGQAFLKMSKMDNHQLIEFQNEIFTKEEERIQKKKIKENEKKLGPLADLFKNLKLKQIRKTDQSEELSTNRYREKLENQKAKREQDNADRKKRYKNFVPFNELVKDGIDRNPSFNFREGSSLMKPEGYINELSTPQASKSKVFHKKNIERSVTGQLNAYGSLKGVVDAHLHNNQVEGQFLNEVYKDKEYESNSEFLNIYLKQKEIINRTSNLMSVKANKLINNIDKDETDYVLKISKKTKKKVLKDIMRLNEQMSTNNRSLVNNKHTHDAVKKVLKEKPSNQVQKRAQFNTAEINYRASFISQKLDVQQSLELYKGWMKQKKSHERANQFDNMAQKVHIPYFEEDEDVQVHRPGIGAPLKIHPHLMEDENSIEPVKYIRKYPHREGMTLQELLAKKLCSVIYGARVYNPEVNIMKPPSFECGALVTLYPIVKNKEIQSPTKNSSFKKRMKWSSMKKMSRGFGLSFSKNSKSPKVARTALNIKRPTIAHFGGRKIDSNSNIYTRTISGNQELTELEEEWTINKSDNFFPLKDLSSFSCINLDHKVYIYGGFYQNDMQVEAKDLNRYVIEVDIHNLSVTKIGKCSYLRWILTIFSQGKPILSSRAQKKSCWNSLPKQVYDCPWRVRY